MSNTQVRKFVSDMYNNVTWRKRVANMSDQQVYAIYCKEQANITFGKPKTKKVVPKKDPDFHQYKIEIDGRIV